MVIVSFIQVFVASATIEYALRMGSQRKMVYVVTDRGEALCEAIIAEGDVYKRQPSWRFRGKWGIRLCVYEKSPSGCFPKGFFMASGMVLFWSKTGGLR